MRQRCFLFFLNIIANIPFVHSQQLLEVDWQEIVCTNQYIDYVYSVCNDKNGNTYTLGSFSNEADCLNEVLNEQMGPYFVMKQNSDGAKLFVKNLGGANNFTFGDIEVCENGDIILGLNFISNFYFNNDSITHSDTWSSIILKLDEQFNLNWFKTYPAQKNTYVKQLVLDKNENIYVSIAFLDSLTINGQLYSQSNGYGTAIAKLNTDGFLNWTRHLSADKFLDIEVLKIKHSDTSEPDLLFLSGATNGDSIFIDGVFKAAYNSKFNRHLFLTTLDEDGTVLQAKFIDDGIQSITDINFYQNRIFLAGVFVDTIKCFDANISPLNNSSIYIGEINEAIELIGFVDLHCNKKAALTSFNISPIYGFLLSGIFDGAFVMQTTHINLSSEYDRGGFIASINDAFNLNDAKFIKGGKYNLRYLTLFDKTITGAAIMEDTCEFQNTSCFAWNDDVSIFQTSDINTLSEFNPISFQQTNPPLPFSIYVYPNPFTSSIQIKFSESIPSTSIQITDAAGQICKEVVFSQFNNSELIVDSRGLSPGLYFIHIFAGNDFEATQQLIKMNGD
jgi:hypothetical protein